MWVFNLFVGSMHTERSCQCHTATHSLQGELKNTWIHDFAPLIPDTQKQVIAIRTPIGSITDAYWQCMLKGTNQCWVLECPDPLRYTQVHSSVGCRAPKGGYPVQSAPTHRRLSHAYIDNQENLLWKVYTDQQSSQPLFGTWPPKARAHAVHARSV